MRHPVPISLVVALKIRRASSSSVYNSARIEASRFSRILNGREKPTSAEETSIAKALALPRAVVFPAAGTEAASIAKLMDLVPGNAANVRDALAEGVLERVYADAGSRSK